MKLKAPRFLDVIDEIAKAGAVRVNDIATATGCDYGPSRRVLDLLSDEGLILKVMRGERTFEYIPANSDAIDLVDAVNEQVEIVDQIVPELGLADRAEDYPDGWLDASRKVINIDPGDPSVWFVRVGKRTVGEIAELDLVDRARYQVVSPWSAKTFDRLSAAVSSIDTAGDRNIL